MMQQKDSRAKDFKSGAFQATTVSLRSQSSVSLETNTPQAAFANFASSIL